MTNASHPICVVADTAVAGTRHIPDMATRAAAFSDNQEFDLIRDSHNPYDEWAVMVMSEDDRIGYVSCECNEFVARLIDGGKHVAGKLSALDQIGSWTRVVMGVYLYD